MENKRNKNRVDDELAPGGEGEGKGKKALDLWMTMMMTRNEI